MCQQSIVSIAQSAGSKNFNLMGLCSFGYVNKIDWAVPILLKSESVLARCVVRAARALVGARQHPPSAALFAARSCARAVGESGVRDLAFLASVRAQRVAPVWFVALACALVLLNPLRSGGFRLRLATMSDEALLTDQQRAVCWATA